MSIAYNAALQTSTAALAACGFRAGREAHHHRVIQSLRYTISADLGLINQLDQYRKKRNMGGYDMAGMISQKEADGMKALAKRLRKKIEEWMRKHRLQDRSAIVEYLGIFRMPLTRDFKETVMLRAKQDPAFRHGLIVESNNAFLEGDLDTGKRLLRDYLNATGALAAVARQLRRNEKASDAWLVPGEIPP